MRIILFSDVHSNLHALEAVIRSYKQYSPDLVICLGDIVSGCAYPNECIELIRSLAIPVLRGNHDEDVVKIYLSGKFQTRAENLNTRAKHWTAEVLKKENCRYLASLPFSIKETIEGLKFLCVHASTKSTTDGIYPTADNSKLSEMVRNEKFDVLCCGHTHYPFLKFFRKKWFINSGTAGRPKMRTPLVNYVVVTIRNEVFEVDFPMVSYNVEQAALSILRTNLPPQFADILRRGIPVPR